jgi:hypothetical protein
MRKKVLTFWIGEFGFEMMGFIPNIKRRLKEEYRGWEVHSISYRGREILYRSICDKFIPIDLTDEDKKDLVVARLSGFNPDITMWGKAKTQKLMQIKKGVQIYNRIIKNTVYDDVLFSVSKDKEKTLSGRDKIFNSWGIYEHLKCNNFSVEKEIRGDYAVIFPRGDGGRGDNASFQNLPKGAWDEVVKLLKNRGITSLYYSHNEGAKATQEPRGAIKINDLSFFTKDNSVDLQTYLIKNARFVLASQVGAVHLAVFAPAKFILCYFDSRKWFDFDWQWKLIDKEKVWVAPLVHFTPERVVKLLEEKRVL